ncbi:MAG: FtsX-like permease family protein, partial [Armatimonadetes bacterium]|nr:FtsX-like permease family protein [Armatimonadota bacterium]
LFRALQAAGWGLVAILAAASLLIITTTIRITIYARRREIRIMQLVGATHWFIRLPFLLEGLLYGFVGGIFGGTVLLGGYTWVQVQVETSFPFIQLVFGPRQLALIGGIIVATGVIFGLVGSLIATREYLREA